MTFFPFLVTFTSACFYLLRFSAAAPPAQQQQQQQQQQHHQHVFKAAATGSPPPAHDAAKSGTFPSDMLNAIDVMQGEFFSAWQGTWPDAIDWTAAVLGTHLPATLSAVSASHFPDGDGGINGISGWHVREDIINDYFGQTIAFHYGQNWLSLRTQANDDMLWVVLGWLEAVNFIQSHSASRHGGESSAWYGHRFLPAFAHRSRIFWEIASQGWDETLCGGGMVWNPRLAPYKNAITNQLYIAASISMYLYFPGDDNDAPFSEARKHPAYPAGDKKYLQAAIEAYEWLMASNMTNNQGLFVDGYHIQGWRGGSSPSNGTGKCDVRDEQVYTYNQGVILTGHRGLWQATGDPKYLDDGHELISNVIKATGWNIDIQKAGNSLKWQGMGRLGVLEERCDILGTCSQDGQTFKGIFFMHYTAFCAPLPHKNSEIARFHRDKCRSYAQWVEHNAMAASLTRDDRGLFSMWWTGALWEGPELSPIQKAERYGPNDTEGTDYRNEGVPDDEVWRDENRTNEDTNFMKQEMWRQLWLAEKHNAYRNPLHGIHTPEIQSGGLSVLRARTMHQIWADL